MEGWERIQYVINNEGLNKNSFSKAIGLNNNVTITRIINEKRNPSRNTCKKIVERFPKYNMGWLLTGEGDSLTSTYSNNKVTVNGNENVSNIGGQHINVSMPESGSLRGVGCFESLLCRSQKYKKFPSPCGVWVVSGTTGPRPTAHSFRPLAGCGLFRRGKVVDPRSSEQFPSPCGVWVVSRRNEK